MLLWCEIFFVEDGFDWIFGYVDIIVDVGSWVDYKKVRIFVEVFYWVDGDVIGVFVVDVGFGNDEIYVVFLFIWMVVSVSLESLCMLGLELCRLCFSGVMVCGLLILFRVMMVFLCRLLIGWISVFIRVIMLLCVCSLFSDCVVFMCIC